MLTVPYKIFIHIHRYMSAVFLLPFQQRFEARSLLIF